ncbi:MAG TPA: helix-turn-helix domain-containing protein [Xanthobacteraceae bacterium]|jgi:putative transcriptional regulator|nr:helix-turn-helix domain-containing protein [Xanthobacteraceae bacterium]
MGAFGKRLIGAAKEARKIARGEADLTTYVINVPSDVDVKKIRRKLKMTQERFATRYGFTAARLKDWEQGRSKPDSAVRAYLMVIDRNPKAVDKALKESTAA